MRENFHQEHHKSQNNSESFSYNQKNEAHIGKRTGKCFVRIPRNDNFDGFPRYSQYYSRRQSIGSYLANRHGTLFQSSKKQESNFYKNDFVDNKLQPEQYFTPEIRVIPPQVVLSQQKFINNDNPFNVELSTIKKNPEYSKINTQYTQNYEQYINLINYFSARKQNNSNRNGYENGYENGNKNGNKNGYENGNENGNENGLQLHSINSPQFVHNQNINNNRTSMNNNCSPVDNFPTQQKSRQLSQNSFIDFSFHSQKNNRIQNSKLLTKNQNNNYFKPNNLDISFGCNNDQAAEQQIYHSQTIINEKQHQKHEYKQKLIKSNSFIFIQEDIGMNQLNQRNIQLYNPQQQLDIEEPIKKQYLPHKQYDNFESKYQNNQFNFLQSIGAYQQFQTSLNINFLKQQIEAIVRLPIKRILQCQGLNYTKQEQIYFKNPQDFNNSEQNILQIWLSQTRKRSKSPYLDGMEMEVGCIYRIQQKTRFIIENQTGRLIKICFKMKYPQERRRIYNGRNYQ